MANSDQWGRQDEGPLVRIQLNGEYTWLTAWEAQELYFRLRNLFDQNFHGGSTGSSLEVTPQYRQDKER